MRNIAEILEDDKNGKRLSQTERQIVVAYIQGKYDAVKELKISNNSNTNDVLDKIRAEISCNIVEDDTSGNIPARLRADWDAANKAHMIDIAIIDRYRAENKE